MRSTRRLLVERVVAVAVWSVVAGARGAVAAIAAYARTATCGVAFWTAVLLPFIYLPLLFAGVSWAVEPSVIATCLAVNVVAVVVGRWYDGAVGQGFESA